MTGLLHDLRYGVRSLLKSPGLTVVVIVTIALAVAVNTVVFSVYDAVALRRIPAKQARQIFRVFRVFEYGSRRDRAFSYPEYQYFAGHDEAFAGLFGESGNEPRLVRVARASAGPPTNEPEIIQGQIVTENYFSVLGATTALGRPFQSIKGNAEKLPVVVLSYPFWKRRFSSAPDALGNVLWLNGTAFTIIGVTTPDFVGTASPPIVPDAWFQISMQLAVEPDNDWIHDSASDRIRLLGRLRPGQSLRKAQSNLALLANSWRQLHPSQVLSKSKIELLPATYFDVDHGSWFLVAVALALSAVALVLLIACANVANLLLARTSARRKEIGVRLALGASRGRLLRQWLTESVFLGLVGGAAGLALSLAASRALSTLVQREVNEFSGQTTLTFLIPSSPDATILAYAISISIAAAIVFGIAPAWRASRSEPRSAMSEMTLPLAKYGKVLKVSLRDLLVMLQVVACSVLLIAAGLFARALVKAASINPGFDTRNIAVVAFNLRGLKYDNAGAATLRRNLLERLQALPNVRSAALTVNVPLLGAGSTTLEPQGVASGPKELRNSFASNVVSPSYFKTLEIPILAGRTFDEREAQSLSTTAIVSERLAQKMWPGQDPIGRFLITDYASGPVQVVGVARDIHSLRSQEIDSGYIYFPFSLDNPALGDFAVFVRTDGDARQLFPAMRAVIQSLDPRLLISSPSGLRVLSETLLFQEIPSKAGAGVAGVLGVFALLLACSGIYGLTSFLVAERTREFGIRMALGANRGDVLALAMRDITRMTGIALLLGLALAATVSRFLSTVLIGVNPNDPMVFVAVTALLFLMALLATYIPARRAAKVDPMVALRYE